MAHLRSYAALTSVWANSFFRKQLPLRRILKILSKQGLFRQSEKTSKLPVMVRETGFRIDIQAYIHHISVLLETNTVFLIFPTLCCIIILSSKDFMSQKSLPICAMERLFSIWFQPAAAEEAGALSGAAPSAGALEAAGAEVAASPAGGVFSRTRPVTTSKARSSCGSSATVKS